LKAQLVKFLKIYGVFLLFALTISLSLELLIPVPEEKVVLGIILFYALFDIPGSLVFYFKKYRARRMGALSAVLGMIFEFTFMRPDWVVNFNIGGALVSTGYWFIAWGAPALVLHKFVFR